MHRVSLLFYSLFFHQSLCRDNPDGRWAYQMSGQRGDDSGLGFVVQRRVCGKESRGEAE